MANPCLPTTRLAALSLMLATAAVAAQPPPPGKQATTRQISATRGVVVFSQLERRLVDAMASNDSTGIDRLLAADFEQRDTTMPNRPQPRTQWLATHVHGAQSFDGMAVHDYGTVTVASFVQAQAGTGRGTIIDIWRRNGNDWQLQLRFVTPAAAAEPSDDGEIGPDGKG